MVREHLTFVELTDKEVLLNAQSMYLAQILLNNPILLAGNDKGLECAMAILTDIPLWVNYCQKMQDVCLKSMSTEHL